VRLEKALATLPAGQRSAIRLHWLPFLLLEDCPAEGMNRLEHLEEKYGPNFRLGLDHCHAIALQEGVDMSKQYPDMVPTIDTHRVLEKVWELKPEVQYDLGKKFLEDYFVKGVNTSKHDYLIEAAVSFGVDREPIASLLADPSGRPALVQKCNQIIRQFRLNGVPFFFFGKRIGLSGAQEVPMLLEAIRRSS